MCMHMVHMYLHMCMLTTIIIQEKIMTLGGIHVGFGREGCGDDVGLMYKVLTKKLFFKNNLKGPNPRNKLLSLPSK